jgi:hypothetical protein
MQSKIGERDPSRPSRLGLLRHRYWLLHAIFLVPLLTGLSGCYPSGTPLFVLGKDSALTVSDITTHAICELYEAMNRHGIAYAAQTGKLPTLNPNVPNFWDSYKLWKQLYDNNFVAVVSLSMQVTNSEGVNPSLALISPLHHVASNFTFNITGQASGSQDRTSTEISRST